MTGAASRILATGVAFMVLGASALSLGTIIKAQKLQLTKLPIQPQSGLKLHTLPAEFPIQKPRWVRVRPDEIVSAEAQEELGTENYVSRWYRRVNTEPDAPEMVVELHCAYYTGMIDTVPHVPERCMVGGGMESPASPTAVPVPLDVSRLVPDPDVPEGQASLLMGRSAETQSRVRMPREIEGLQMMVAPFRDPSGRSEMWAGYFFIANGGVVASAYDVRLLAFKLQDEYAYYMKVQFLSPSVRSGEELAAVAAEMLNDLLPELMRRVPDWSEVEAGVYPPDNPRRATAPASEPRNVTH